MAQPTAYERIYNFTNFQSQSPDDPLPGNQVDAELNAVKNSSDETQANLALIQRDDGQLANDSVGLDQLKAEVEIGVNPPSAWVTSTNYAVAETVTFEAGFYRCLIAHVSGVFATDLAAAKWELIADFASAIGSSAVATLLHDASSKTEPVDADEFMGNDSADTFTLRRFTWANIKTYMVAGIGALLNTSTAKTTPVDADNVLISDSAATHVTKKVTFANIKAAVYSALGATVAALTGKTTPVDADTFPISDSAAADVAKKLTWANLLATMFTALGGLVNSATGKTTPVDADMLVIADSAASNASKKLTFVNLKATLKTYFDTLYGAGAYPPGHLYGLALTNGTDATNDIDIAAGSARDDSDTANIVLAALTKRGDAAWAVGSGNGGMDTGSIADGVNYVWGIKRSGTGVTDALISASGTAPTMPADYDLKVLLGSFYRTGGVNKAPRSLSQKEGTKWVSYTPTFTGFGTPSSVSFFSRRVGDTLEVRGKFTSGTPTATEARISLGFNGTDGNVTSDATKVASIQVAGFGRYAAATANQPSNLIESSVGYLTCSVQAAGAAGLTKLDGNAFIGTGATYSFQAAVPIAGW